MKKLNKKSFLVLSAVLIMALGSNIRAQEDRSVNADKNSLKAFLSDTGYTELEMQKLPSGHLHLTGVLNGVQAKFILDTGASGTLMDRKNKDKFKMESKESELQAAGAGTSNMQMQASSNNQLTLGDLKIDDMNLMLIDMDHVNKAFERFGLEPVDGVIGADLLTNYKAIIDYVNLSLYVKN
ncbi:retropepsin-like aspartic protease [Flagellimonas nanhaiensis]|uniref:Acid protease n=1 Tax=Flagellimonas nanhaiensis TaxID=2292706 RepID=A0A371JLE8_9FLAO|nr:aspartyl protease family protein [Allomuricauda nanhaiensis]RDY57741.1 acid protease [Allomuricauda nanhaiensis]